MKHHPSIIPDAMHNLSSSENGDRHDYGCGVLVGLVAGLMWSGLAFEDAIALCRKHAPSDVHPARVPDSWREAMGL